MTEFSILFFNKRTGSTFLQNAINSSSYLFGCDECFVNVCRKAIYRKSGYIPFVRPENKYKDPQKYINNILNTNKDKKAVCMKIAFNQIAHHSGLIQYIENNNIPILFLQRKNLVKQIISGMTAASTSHKPVNITGRELLDMVNEAKRLNEDWKKRLNKHIKLVLEYEDIIGETIGDKTYMSNNSNIAVCDFFGIKQEKLYSKTKKKNKNNIEVYLPNIEDIRNVFKNTEFEWML